MDNNYLPISQRSIKEIGDIIINIEKKEHGRKKAELLTQIADSLTVEQLMEVDEYIMQTNLLTK